MVRFWVLDRIRALHSKLRSYDYYINVIKNIREAYCFEQEDILTKHSITQ